MLFCVPLPVEAGCKGKQLFSVCKKKVKTFSLPFLLRSASFKRGAKVHLISLFPSSVPKNFFSFSAPALLSASFRLKRAAKVSGLFCFFQLLAQIFFSGRPEAKEASQLGNPLPRFGLGVQKCGFFSACASPTPIFFILRPGLGKT